MHKSLHILLVITVMVLFSACSGNRSNNPAGEPGSKLISSDLENVSWINQNTLSKDIAHSGVYSSKLDTTCPYSFGFSNNFKILGDTLPTSVDVNVWVLFPELKIKSCVVVSIDSVNKNIFWKGIPINDSIKTVNQWQQIKTNFELPKKIMSTDNVKIYVWSNDKRTFYMDDISILFHNE
jgi:hypothetical protein